MRFFALLISLFAVFVCDTFAQPEPLLSLTHTPGDLNMGIFNDGFIGPEITWKGQNGLFGGSPIFGTAAAGSVNGQFPPRWDNRFSESE